MKKKLNLSKSRNKNIIGGKRSINIDPASKHPIFRINNNVMAKHTGKIPHKNNPFNPVYNVNKIRQMNWKQLKKRYPNMNPTADADFDGLINSKDCKPLDPSKDGVFSRFLGKVTGDKYGQTAEDYKAEKAAKSSAKFEKKMEKDISRQNAAQKESAINKFRDNARKRLEEIRAKSNPRIVSTAEKKVKVYMARREVPTTQKTISQARARQKKAIIRATEGFSGVKETGAKAKTAKGQKQAGAGRPKQSYKYRDPRTGQPIPAVEYHRIKKALKNQARTVEDRAETQQRFALARRGLSPEEISAAQQEMNDRMARLRAIKEMRQEQQLIEQLPQPDITEEVPETRQLDQAEQYPQVEQPRQIRQVPIRRVIVRQQPAPTNRFSAQSVPQGYRLQEDIMTGRKTLVALPPQEAWTRTR